MQARHATLRLLFRVVSVVLFSSFCCCFFLVYHLLFSSVLMLQCGLWFLSSLQRYGCRGLWWVAAAGRAAGSGNGGCVRAAARWEEPPGDPAGRGEASIPHPHPHLARCSRRESVRHIASTPTRNYDKTSEGFGLKLFQDIQKPRETDIVVQYQIFCISWIKRFALVDSACWLLSVNLIHLPAVLE